MYLKYEHSLKTLKGHSFYITRNFQFRHEFFCVVVVEILFIFFSLHLSNDF